MAKAVAFDRQTGERVLQATRAVEKMAPPSASRPATGGPGPQVTKLIIGVITSNATGGGKYYGKQIIPQGAAVNVATNLAQSDIGTLSDDTIVFLNLEEIGASTHVLTENSELPYFVGRVIAYSTEATPKLVVAGYSIISSDCADV